MKVKDCIGLTMRVLGYIIDNNPERYRANLCEVINENNFNRAYLGIDEKGFYIEEYKEFNGSLAYVVDEYSEEVDSYRIHVSPYYIVRLLFENEKSFRQMDAEKALEGKYIPTSSYSMKYHGISWIMRNFDITEQTLYTQISSYRKIASLISVIRMGSDMGEEYSLSYINLKKELDKIIVRDSNSLAARIKSLKNMSYEDIACLRLRKPELARTIAVMDEIEELLVDASLYIYADRLTKETNGDFDEIFSSLVTNVDKETLLDEKISSWNTFTKWLYVANYDAICNQNNRFFWRCDVGKLTTFGLDKINLPGNPEELKSRKKL